MTHPGPRGIAVLDIGASHTRLALFDPELNERGVEQIRSTVRAGPPYLHLDLGPALNLVARALPRLDAILPVDALVPCAHGSALALLDPAGALVLPIMAYGADPPGEIVESYARIAPPFDEVFAQTNPAALTLGRQLHWQETAFPEAFANAAAILPLAQYAAYRLGGRGVAEVTALGAQTHLWAPEARTFSTLAEARGWARRIAPMTPAWEALGTLDLKLRGEGRILTGIHDSNANLLRYRAARPDPFTLLSTGTWIIGFDTGAGLQGLEAARDLVSNTDIFGAPVAASRFMGGREFEILAAGAPAEVGSVEAVRALVSAGTMALPSFTDSGGPVPETGGRGRIIGPPPEGPPAHASLAALYTALMSSVSLRGLGPSAPVIVDGPFAANGLYLGLLARALPEVEILASAETNGTRAGAALLALMPPNGALPERPIDLTPVAPADIPGFDAYAAQWWAWAHRGDPPEHPEATHASGGDI
ncbi:MAG: hypothetical protein AAGE18_00760 [Pseudomonadota bacterium]